MESAAANSLLFRSRYKRASDEEFIIRNEVPPISVDIGGTATGPHMVDTPPIGWLVFHNHDDRRVDIDREGGIRDELGARPKEVYSHYDESGKRVAGTLCLPPEKCGVLRVCADPED